jgi:hypothetical protein
MAKIVFAPPTGLDLDDGFVRTALICLRGKYSMHIYTDRRNFLILSAKMPFLARVRRALAKKGLRYAVVGGHAVALHGAVRGTVDVDIAMTWSLKSLEAAEEALWGLGLVSRLPVSAKDVFHFRDEYVRNRNLSEWNFYKPQNLTEQVDIVITYDLKGKPLTRIATADGPIRVLSRKDLIETKRSSGRPQDLEDADALERLK